MPAAEPDLHEQLLEAHASIRREIDRLEARYYPVAPIGFVRGGVFPLVLFLLGLGVVSPFRTNGVFLDNSALIGRLTAMLRDVEDASDQLASDAS